MSGRSRRKEGKREAYGKGSQWEGELEWDGSREMIYSMDMCEWDSQQEGELARVAWVARGGHWQEG